MPPHILSPKPKNLQVHTIHTISGPIEGSFTHVSRISPLEEEKHRYQLLSPDPPPSSTIPSANSSSPNTTNVSPSLIATTSRKHRHSPSISAPVQGSFRHVAHMGHNVEKGFFSTNVDPSWQNLLEHLPDIRITLPVNSKPRRPRRLSEPEPPLPSDNDEVFPLPKSAPGVPIKSRTFASHRTTQSHDYDLRAGRSEFRRSPGNATSDRSLRRKPNLPEGMQVSRSISEATAALLSTPSTPRKQIGTTDTAARDRSNPLQRTRSEPRRLDGTSRRRVVHRKAVPKLELDDSNIISDASSSPARRRTDMKWGVHSVPRPVARYFDDSPIDKLFDPPSSAPAAASEEKGKRKEEVAHWRKEMQRKSEIYEQQVIEHTDEMPPLPIPIPPVHTASLTAREQVMHSIKTALDCDDFSELSLLKDDGAQLAVDTVWEMLSMPTPTRSTSNEPSTTYRIKRAQLRRLSLKLVLQYDRMPTALFLSGVQCHDREAPVGGGFADVYCGQFGNMKVALKCLRAFKMSSDVAKIRLKRAFYRESLLWQDLAHPHILPFLGVSEGVFKHSICMVLPWMEHGNILNHMDNLKESGKLSDHNRDAVINQWCYETALGLSYLHEEGIVHGDLRGANILVDDNGRIRLADFGMSVIAESTGNSSACGGAKRWLSPELINPEQFNMTSSCPTYASDIYSFALTVVELFTGNPPFETLREHQIIHHVLKGNRPPRPSITVDVMMSDRLWKVVTLCWRHHPANRPTASHVVQALESATRQRLT